jgi:hypothetical protein
MSGTDWALVILTGACLNIVAAVVGWTWGRWSRIAGADATIEELHKLYAMSSEENAALRNDLTRQLNEQFER